MATQFSLWILPLRRTPACTKWWLGTPWDKWQPPFEWSSETFAAALTALLSRPWPTQIFSFHGKLHLNSIMLLSSHTKSKWDISVSFIVHIMYFFSKSLYHSHLLSGKLCKKLVFVWKLIMSFHGKLHPNGIYRWVCPRTYYEKILKSNWRITT